jgi:hypothetical protein
MSFKTTYILLGILLGTAVVFGVALWLGPQPSDPSTFVFPSTQNVAHPIKPKDIDKVEIDRTSPTKEKFVFVREEGDRWAITEPRALRANSDEINLLIRHIMEAHREKLVDKPASASAAGLEPPEEVITLSRGSEPPLVLKVGTSSPGETSSVLYVQSSDRPKEILAVRKSSLDNVKKGLVAFRERNLLPSASSDIDFIKITEIDKGKEKGPVQLAKRKDRRWYYEKPFIGDADVEGDTAAAQPGQPPSGVQNLLTDLSNLSISYFSDKENDFVADEVSDLGKYGLDPKKDDVLRIEIKRVDEITKTTGSEPERKTSTITVLVAVGKKEGDKYYAYREGEKDVVKIAARNIDPARALLDKPDALRDRHLVRSDSAKDLDAINIENSSGLLEFRRTGTDKPWQFYRGDTLQTGDPKMVDGLVTLLSERRKDMEFLDPQKNPVTPAITVSLWVGGVAKEDKKEEQKDDKKDEKKDDKKNEKKEAKPALKAKDKPTYKLLFAAPKDAAAQDVLVRRETEGEEPAVLKVPRVIYDRLSDGPLAYMDKTLPQFVSGFDATKDVTRLMLQGDGKVIEVSREAKEKAPWKIDQPKELAGREADESVIASILGSLNQLKATRLIAESAKDPELESYGLKTPANRAVVTVTKDGKSEKFEFDFGKEKDGDVYAKQSQRGMIFLVAKSTLDNFKRDLLDTTVFKFDEAKVKNVKMVFFVPAIKASYTLELARKDNGEWETKVPKDDKDKLDQRKISNFVGSLSFLKAEKFLAHNSKPTPDQELEVAKGAMTIEVTVEESKDKTKKYQLTVGKADGDKGFIATSEQLPGDIFLVPKFLFENVKKEPGYFKQ